MKYVLSIDQSTSGTKALLFDETGTLIRRADLPHKQIVNEKGWVEHDLNEIYCNTIDVVKNVVEAASIDKADIVAVGISNQRETATAWNKLTGEPVYNAIVWQCARGEAICAEIEKAGHAEMIKARTGLHLSPYFTAAKLAWILQNVDCDKSQLNCGTVDSFLIFKLTKGKAFKTDYSNASRTQLLNLSKAEWDAEICALFGIEPYMLPQLCDSNALFGETDFEGYLDNSIPIHGVLGDSHGALFGQGCLTRGMIKCTYGTGSSVMMNVGHKPAVSNSGVVSSIAWAMDGKIEYVLEGNINYTGAIMKWICDDLGLIASPKEAATIAATASDEDSTYLVPAFTGLGAPYWDSNAKAALIGMTRHTKRAEIVRAAEESIAYQIADIVSIMAKDSGVAVAALRVDGGPTRDNFLMQFQSDILAIPIMVPSIEELSGMGAAFMAGVGLGIYDIDNVLSCISRKSYEPKMPEDIRVRKYNGWKNAINKVLIDGGC